MSIRARLIPNRASAATKNFHSSSVCHKTNDTDSSKFRSLATSYWRTPCWVTMLLLSGVACFWCVGSRDTLVRWNTNSSTIPESSDPYDGDDDDGDNNFVGPDLAGHVPLCARNLVVRLSSRHHRKSDDPKEQESNQGERNDDEDTSLCHGWLFSDDLVLASSARRCANAITVQVWDASIRAWRLRSILKRIKVDNDIASILLHLTPDSDMLTREPFHYFNAPIYGRVDPHGLSQWARVERERMHLIDLLLSDGAHHPDRHDFPAAVLSVPDGKWQVRCVAHAPVLSFLRHHDLEQEPRDDYGHKRVRVNRKNYKQQIIRPVYRAMQVHGLPDEVLRYPDHRHGPSFTNATTEETWWIPGRLTHKRAVAQLMDRAYLFQSSADSTETLDVVRALGEQAIIEALDAKFRNSDYMWEYWDYWKDKQKPFSGEPFYE